MPAKEIEVRTKMTVENMAALQEFCSKLDGAKVTLLDVGKTAEKSNSALGQLKSGIMELGQQLVAFVGLEKLSAWMIRGIDEAGKEQRAWRQLGEAAVRWHQDAGGAYEATERLAASTSGLGMDLGDTSQEFRKFLDLTHSVKEAEDDVALSADVAAGVYGGNYARAQELVTGLIQHRRGALREAQRAGAEGAKTEGEALEMLYKAYHGAAAKLDDFTAKAARFKVELKEEQQQIGAGLIPVVEKLFDWWHNLILAFEVAGITVIAFFDNATKRTKEWFSLLGTMASTGEFWKHPLDAMAKVQNAYITMTKNGLSDFIRDVKEGVTEAADEMESQLSRRGGSTGDKPKEHPWKEKTDDAGTLQKAIENLARAQAELAKAETDEAREALSSAEGKKAIFKAASDAAQAIEREKKAEKDAIQVETVGKIEAAKGNRAEIEAIKQEETQRLLALDKKYASEEVKVWADAAKRQQAITKTLTEEEAKQGDKRLQNAKKTADLIDKAEELADKRYLKSLKKVDQQVLQDKKKELLQISAALRAAGVTDLETYQNIATAMKGIDVAVAKNKVDVNLAATAQVIGALSGAFGKAKAFAYAEDIIQTYLAATTAISAPPYGYGPTYVGYAAMAAAIITGLANAAKINSQGGGFDDPRNDLAAHMGGYRWANDMVREFSAGVSRGWADRMKGGMSGAVTNINNTTTNRHAGQTVIVNQGLLVGGESDQAWRDVRRRFNGADKAYRRTLLGRQATAIGSSRRLGQ